MKYETFNKSIKLFNYTSQFGEDSILDAIFSKIGINNKWCLEVGAADGIFASNTNKLIQDGWKSIQIESDDLLFNKLKENYGPNHNVICIHEKVGIENGRTLQAILDRVGAPKEIDLIVIDVDGQDYHIFNSLIEYSPRVVIIEYDHLGDANFIPQPNGEGQAGFNAVAKLLISRGYQPICATTVNIIAVRHDLAKLLEDELNSLSKDKTLLITDKGIYTTLEIEDLDSGNKETLKVAAITSVPRHGFTSHQRMLFASLLPLGIPLKVVGGVWWEQSLQEGIKSLLEAGTDVIVVIDYDSLFFPDDLRKLFLTLVKYPQMDVVMPWQLRRGTDNNVLFGMRVDGNGEAVSVLHPSLFFSEINKIQTGHFGLTLLRSRVFKDLPKPWFLNVPNEQGDWSDGKVNADIYFWRKLVEYKRNVYVANLIKIGHIDEYVISVDNNFQARKQTLYDYLKEHNG